MPYRAGLQDGRAIARDAVPGLALERVANVEPACQRALDLTRCPATPWHGPGSQPAVMVLRGDQRWRVKATADARSSAMEVALGKLFQLTGLAAPDTELVAAVDGLPDPGLHVGSCYDPRFQDLGDFLVSDAAADQVAPTGAAARSRYDALRSAHARAVAGNATLLRTAGVEWWALQGVDAREHAANDQARFTALDAMNRMLPLHLRCEQLRHYVVSRWLANWDQLNYRLENFGYTVRDGARVGLSLDFGSSGPLGFRHLQSGRMLPKADSCDVAMAQRPASLFPIPLAFADNSAHFDVLGPDPGPLQDTLAWPYGFQSDSVAALLRPPVAADPMVADTLAEMGYRLALLPARAVLAVVERHWPDDAAAAPGWPDPKAMASRLLVRRDALVARFDPAQLRDWIEADPARAARVRLSLARAAD